MDVDVVEGENSIALKNEIPRDFRDYYSSKGKNAFRQTQRLVYHQFAGSLPRVVRPAGITRGSAWPISGYYVRN